MKVLICCKGDWQCIRDVDLSDSANKGDVFILANNIDIFVPGLTALSGSFDQGHGCCE